MPPLGNEYDTFREFFSRENCQILCNSDREYQQMIEFADSIPDLIRGKIQQMITNGEIRPGPQNENLELIPEIGRIFTEIVSNFQNSRLLVKELKHRYSVFKGKRKGRPAMLRECANNINLDKKNCNISTTVGSVSGILGGCLLAAGTFMTGGAAAPLVVSGLAASGLGSGTSLGTSFTEIIRLRKFVKKAQKIIDEDQEDFKQFSNVLERSLDTEEVIKKVLDINLLKQTIDDIGTVFRGTLSFRSKIDSIKEKINTFVRNILLDNEVIGEVMYWVTYLSLAVGFVFALVSIQSRNRFVYQAGMAVLKVGLTAARLLDVGVDACTSGLSAIRAGGAVVTKSVGRAAAHGALAAVGIGLDVTTLVLTSIDIHNGSISETATKINAVADRMERELEILKEIYKELN